jgi:hypothetical protein
LNCPVKEFDGKALGVHLKAALPPYAVPVFVRVRSELEVTGTFKHRKVELKNQGFDVDLVKDPIYYLKDGGSEYVKLTKKVMDEFQEGNVRV